jgi:beta-phosphoglucomutase
MTEEKFRQTFGRTSREIIDMIWDQIDTADDIRKIDERKEAAYRKIIKENMPFMPGAHDLLNRLHEAGFKLAIGSSGPIENVELAIELMQIGPLLDGMVTGGEVELGKPNPEVFLKAAEKLGLPPRQCVVVEDASVGVEAAHAAGMPVVGLVSTGHVESEFNMAELIIHHLDELDPEIMQHLIETGMKI